MRAANLWVVLAGAGLLWIGWCFLVIYEVVPAVLRKLTIYPAVTAWVLCILPVLICAAVIISRTSDEHS